LDSNLHLVELAEEESGQHFDLLRRGQGVLEHLLKKGPTLRAIDGAGNPEGFVLVLLSDWMIWNIKI
jgi:hypothetical protein